MKVKYITSNNDKFEVAKNALGAYGIELMREALETPEIQSADPRKTALYSACWASEKLGEAVVVTDVGHEIKALRGFPGPFVKYVNAWFTAEDYLRLMEGIEDRRIDVRECLAYCEPGKKPATFIGVWHGTIARKIGRPGRSSIDQIFIPEGYDEVETELPADVMLRFWSMRTNHWKELAEYLSKVSTGS